MPNKRRSVGGVKLVDIADPDARQMRRRQSVEESVGEVNAQRRTLVWKFLRRPALCGRRRGLDSRA